MKLESYTNQDITEIIAEIVKDEYYPEYESHRIKENLQFGEAYLVYNDNLLVGLIKLSEDYNNYKRLHIYTKNQNFPYEDLLKDVIEKENTFYLTFDSPNELLENEIKKYSHKIILKHAHLSEYLLSNDELEETFFIIKPDGQEKIEEIFSILRENDFHIIRSFPLLNNKDIIEAKLKKHYSHIVDKPFYKDVESYMTSGILTPGILVKKNAIEDLRKVMGSTDPNKAEKGTIRNLYGKNDNGKIYNVIHGSDSKEAVEREKKIWLNF